MSVSVSETIGKLLLEGYKMLADSCEICCTVLMQDRRGRVICVQCESASMANTVAHGAAAAATSGNMSSGKLTNGTANNVRQGQESVRNNLNGPNLPPAAGNADSAMASTVSTCEDVLMKEIQNATAALQLISQHQHDMQGRLVYVKYIRECAETIQSLQAVKRS